ncbi:protein NRT1/ PTR FAMILY 5.10-like [Cocos nucifera]|uniref:Protein NRT1/ PTR FAMILY 5.10-like n=1 Tax=Cocos nucifera TaxID=13894 RepID=A0A8K0IWU4_COCNU|nr:protein NRT1/ PTR FAMILY 5.10-like [Cocos nucifera]
MLTLSAMLPTLFPPNCNGAKDSTPCPPARFHVIAFYFSLYVVALAQGGQTPCAVAFGADQFDENEPEECKDKSSFFNWWYFATCGGSNFAMFMLNYVQDNIGWALAFGISGIAMAIALLIFLTGSRTYRRHRLEHRNPFTAIFEACITSISSQQSLPLHTSKDEAREALLAHAAHRSKFSHGSNEESVNEDSEVEEVKGLLRLFPIWASCLFYSVVLCQSSTFFTKQASTLDRTIGTSFQVPPAALQGFIGLSSVAFVPIYDRVVLPIARKYTGKISGITMLQRIGTGLALSTITTVAAALIEMKRLKTARDFGLVDQPNATIPMSISWMIPEYVMYGMTTVLTVAGLQEFFYDQVPATLRSLGLALFLSILGIGNFASGFLVSVIEKVTRKRGESWFSDNLNRAHLDYFYWLLAGVSAIEFIIYVYFARSYVYKRKITVMT